MITVGPDSVAGAVFATDGAVGQLVHDGGIANPSELVCMVTLHGTFDVITPPGVKTIVAYHTVYMIFDGKSGNLKDIYAR
jgi:hypothetical protein